MAELLTKEEIFNIWAPPGGLWSPWVKPVLFACMNGLPPAAELPVPAWSLDWVPPAGNKVAMVLDLPREDGVLMGLELARRGYRPVPLYNAIPGPTAQDLSRMGDEFYMSVPVVEVAPIKDALWRGAENLAQLSIESDAPPVFLLDANRRTGRWSPPMPGNFDNRSVSFTTDFPSAIFLQSHGISQAILVQNTGDQPQPDLAHTLRRWQDAGMVIELKRLEIPGQPWPCSVEKPSWFGAIWYRVLVALGLRKHALGGYGGIIGLPSAG